MKLYLYNTLSRKKEIFKPIQKDQVGLYTCGPTVYDFPHLGNYRTYIFEDVLRRTLTYQKFRVTHIMNITDVGHLTSDADAGEDKLEKGAAREGKTVREIAQFYTDAFLKDLALLNIKRAHKLIPATSAIKEQIALIQQLFKKGYAYETPEAVYYDVSRFRNYTKLSGQKLEQKKTGARKEVATETTKQHPQDFALWFKRIGRFAHHTMHWNSPWGDGFPGWHIECSAISTKYLGQPFDIHTGGVDHISVHHPNEIAQSEGAYGKPLARFWMHGEFLLIDRAKMAKSAGNFYTLSSLTEKGYPPLSFRYLVLGAHYRKKLNFTRESLEAAKQSLEKLYEFVRELRTTAPMPKNLQRHTKSLHIYAQKFAAAINNNLDTPHALSLVWMLIRAYHKNPLHYHPPSLLKLLFDFDTIFGLQLQNVQLEKIPREINTLVALRERHRKNNEWTQADMLRHQIDMEGFIVEDTPQGPRLKRK
ncbi:MAG: cysteinyl-tRNA synthetase [Parcubacteria group bacterium Gr01-1014_66]|nr:MAG: cysteinyl-tRNA synthetase [Parcubacteria group bacterium Gr01-1014_66]